MMEKILVIEDEENLRDNLELLLTDEGYHVATAEEGKEGIQCLEKEPFDLVITDMMMGDVGGFAVLEYVTTHALDTLVIFITGFASTDSAIAALRKGVYDYIAKPFDIDMLLIVIERALEKLRLQREIKTYLQELELRVADRTKELEETNNRLNRSLEELRATQGRSAGELMSGVAQELNKPLTSVLGYAELLANTPSIPCKERSMLGTIYQEAIRCSQIIRKFLSEHSNVEKLASLSVHSLLPEDP